jgi:hypothetical protein
MKSFSMHKELFSQLSISLRHTAPAEVGSDAPKITPVQARHHDSGILRRLHRNPTCWHTPSFPLPSTLQAPIVPNIQVDVDDSLLKQSKKPKSRAAISLPAAAT